MTKPTNLQVFRDFPDDTALQAVLRYVTTGELADWKLLYRESFPEYGSRLDFVAKQIPISKVEPGQNKEWDRVFRVVGSFLDRSPLCDWCSTLLAVYGESDWLENLAAIVHDDHRLRFEKRLICYTEKENGDGSPNAIGKYFLARDFDLWKQLILSRDESVLGLAGVFAGFLYRHAPDKMGDCWKELLGYGDLEKDGDRIAMALYRSGLVDAREQVLFGIEKCEKVAQKFYQLRDCCEIDSSFHLGSCKQAALACLSAPSGECHQSSPAKWLATHFPSEAGVLLADYVGKIEDDGTFSHWGSAAKDALEILGPENGKPLLAACAGTEFCDTVFAGAAGAIAGGFPAPDEEIETLIRRLLKVGDSHWTRQALTEAIRWQPEAFRKDIEALSQHQDPELSLVGKEALLEIDLLSIDPFAQQQRDELRFERSLEDLGHSLKGLVQNTAELCLHIRCSGDPPSPGKSHFGGAPLLTDDTPWPTNRNGVKLPFIAKLRESDIINIHFDFKGDLLFFADWEAGDCAVIHSVFECESIPAVDQGGVNYRAMEFEAGLGLPDGVDPFDAWKFESWRECPELDGELIRSLFHSFSGRGFSGDNPTHRAFGFPRFTQMGPKAFAAQIFDPLDHPPDEEDDWISLLSLETDPAAGIGFYDTGTMTFLISKPDWNAGRFDNVELHVDYM